MDRIRFRPVQTDRVDACGIPHTCLQKRFTHWTNWHNPRFLRTRAYLYVTCKRYVSYIEKDLLTGEAHKLVDLQMQSTIRKGATANGLDTQP